MNFSNSITENTFLSKWNKDDSFYLLRVGGLFSPKPINPFVGRVASSDEGSIISGKFTLIKSSKIILGCFFGFAWAIAFFMCFLNRNFNFTGKTITFLAYATWTVLGYVFFRYVPNLFHRKEQEAVIDFIERNLLE
jgi:hypothetical protein